MDRSGRANPLFNANRLKLGTFCTNTTLSMTTVPEVWRPSWSNIEAAAVMADRAGLEAIVPLARWKGYVDNAPEHFTNTVQEAFTFAAAVAQATKYSAVFTTTHAPMFHPLVAAKQAATIDHISGGRFALNVVGGWNRREFEMFGLPLLEHSERYAYLRDWLKVVKALWQAPGEIDWDSKYFKMKRAVCRPRPIQQPCPPIMNAGLSREGMSFATENADIAFVNLIGDDPAAWRTQIAEYKDLARKHQGLAMQVWTNVQVVQAETTAVAEKYLKHYADDFRDHRAVDGFFTGLMAESRGPSNPTVEEVMRARLAAGGNVLVGDADGIAARLRAMSDAGIDGVLMSFVNFLEGLAPFISGVLPLLEQVGLRAPFAGAPGPMARAT